MRPALLAAFGARWALHMYSSPVENSLASYRPRSPAELTAITFATARGEVNAEALSIWLRQRTRRREGF